MKISSATIKWLVVIFGLIGFFMVRFAHADDPGRPLIYCPKEIDCAVDGNKNSCQAIGDNLFYWDLNNLQESGRINKGVYKLSSVSASYQAPPERESQIYCAYWNWDSGFSKNIYIISKIESHLQAIMVGENAWSPIGYGASCQPNNASNLWCPLIQDN